MTVAVKDTTIIVPSHLSKFNRSLLQCCTAALASVAFTASPYFRWKMQTRPVRMSGLEWGKGLLHPNSHAHTCLYSTVLYFPQLVILFNLWRALQKLPALNCSNPWWKTRTAMPDHSWPTEKLSANSLNDGKASKRFSCRFTLLARITCTDDMLITILYN